MTTEEITKSWYSGSFYDRTIFRYLRWEEIKIRKLAKSILLAGPVIVVIGVILFLFGI